MKRHELVERLSAHFPELRKKELQALVEASFEEIARFLKSGGRVEFRGFGRFEIHRGKERVFVNPKNHETYYLPGNQRLVFKVGKDLKERLNRPPLAAMDLGTQTFRLALGKRDSNGGLRIIARERYNVRLGEGLAVSGQITPEAMERGLSALRSFRERLEELEVSTYRAVGTAVFRRAQNSEEFLRKAKELGFDIEVVSPEKEMELMLRGVTSGLGLSEGRLLLVDAGGGSTELVLVVDGQPVWKKSLPLGVVVLKEAYIKAYPLTREEYRRLRAEVVRTLAEVDWPKEIDWVVACGGTASLMASLDLKLVRYLPERIHGHRLRRERIEALGEHLRTLSLAKIRRLRGMEAGREDIAFPGLLIYSEILRKLDLPELVVSEWGLLEGLLLSF